MKENTAKTQSICNWMIFRRINQSMVGKNFSFICRSDVSWANNKVNFLPGQKRHQVFKWFMIETIPFEEIKLLFQIKMIGKSRNGIKGMIVSVDSIVWIASVSWRGMTISSIQKSTLRSTVMITFLDRLLLTHSYVCFSVASNCARVWNHVHFTAIEICWPNSHINERIRFSHIYNLPASTVQAWPLWSVTVAEISHVWCVQWTPVRVHWCFRNKYVFSFFFFNLCSICLFFLPLSRSIPACFWPCIWLSVPKTIASVCRSFAYGCPKLKEPVHTHHTYIHLRIFVPKNLSSVNLGKSGRAIAHNTPIYIRWERERGRNEKYKAEIVMHEKKMNMKL